VFLGEVGRLIKILEKMGERKYDVKYTLDKFFERVFFSKRAVKLGKKRAFIIKRL